MIVLAVIILIGGFLLAGASLMASFKSSGDGPLGYGILTIIIFLATLFSMFALLKNFSP